MDENEMGKDWDKLFEDIDQEFPRTPFDISCINDIHELDDEFCSDNAVIIVDDRAKYWYCFGRKDFEDDRDVSKYINYTVVRRVDDEPITLRQVIQAMIDDKHYWDTEVQKDNHRFLEGFDRRSHNGIEWVAFWGS